MARHGWRKPRFHELRESRVHQKRWSMKLINAKTTALNPIGAYFTPVSPLRRYTPVRPTSSEQAYKSAQEVTYHRLYNRLHGHHPGVKAHVFSSFHNP